MRRLPALMLLSVFAAPGLSPAAEPAASGSHPVAPEPHGAEAVELESEQPSAQLTADDTTPEMTERWYGWQSLSADGAALLLLIAAGASSDQRNPLPDVLAYSSIGVYLFGGPVSHAARDNPGRALGSLVMRAGLPLAFGAVGSQLEDCSGDEGYDLCGIVGALLGGTLGIATAITIDAALLSYEEVPVTSEGLQNAGVSIGPHHAGLVAGGTF